jgi:hypothetical protein
MVKTCPWCRTERPLTEFRAWQNVCILCDKKKRAAKDKAWRSLNIEQVSVRKKGYYKANREYFVDAAIRRKRTVKGQTPAWANLVEVRAFYREAREFRLVGINATVDHIVPLRGKLVSGLHCEANLTIKLAAHNGSKCNKFDPASFDPVENMVAR